ncbi:hypothetical protein PCCS19_00450 [Paenibacillus sp. CCS19]|uniref:VanZ family protein n=1 Tax=Paenibacillus sp. CCS19 TaxID=3158387 RepID=UPI0025664359|nr:VanZ family protein [Paenibacillus cellulosilyticus]GMK36992.1 hypothetical protein PCCS19_00450 [Paenibacillus cellulosilyticus]
MRNKWAMRSIPVTVLFVVYLYILTKIILFKFGHVDLMFLLRQANWAIHDMSRLHYRLDMANLTPFRTIAENLRSHSVYEYIQLYGNIGLFIPFGIFVPYLTRGTKLDTWTYGLVFILSFALCLLLECTQLVCSIGMFDVDDLILNTAGGMVGCVLFHLIVRVTSPGKTAAAAR